MEEVVDGEAAWAPPNDNCETYFIFISTFRKKIMFHKGFFKPFSIQICFVTRSKKKKKKKKMRPYSGVTAVEDGVGQLPGRP